MDQREFLAGIRTQTPVFTYITSTFILDVSLFVRLLRHVALITLS